MARYKQRREQKKWLLMKRWRGGARTGGFEEERCWEGRGHD
jgi:hypothetical protein